MLTVYANSLLTVFYEQGRSQDSLLGGGGGGVLQKNFFGSWGGYKKTLKIHQHLF